MLHNVMLNESYTVEDNAKVIEYLKTADSTSEVADILQGKAWQQTVAHLAYPGGIPEKTEDAFAKLEALETDVRTAFAIPSKRPGGARSKGTGFALHGTFKAYKSVIKGALENGVELLDAAGTPRSKKDVTDDIAKSKVSVKSPLEKLTGATSTWLAIYDGCDPNDPGVIALVNMIATKTGMPELEGGEYHKAA
jgi:hypothetical protein